MEVILVTVGKTLLIIIPIIIGIYFAFKKNYKGVIISLIILILISIPLTVKDVNDSKKTKGKLDNIKLSLSETKIKLQETEMKLYEVELFNEFLLEKQELRSLGFPEEFIEYLKISPIASHHAIKGNELYCEGHYKEAINHFQEILKIPIIKNGEYQDILINTNWMIANCYVLLGDLKEALIYYQELPSLSEAIIEKNKRLYAKAASLVAIGYIKSRLSEKDKEEAIIILNEASDLFKSVDMNFPLSDFDFPTGDSSPSVLSYRALISVYLGNIFCSQNKPYEGLSKYQDALGLYEFEKEIKYPSIMATNLRIGNIYKNLCETKKADKHYKNILQLNQEIEDNPDLLKNETFHQKEERLVSVGRAFFNINNYQESLEKLEEVLEMNLKIGRKFGIANSLTRIGNFYLNSDSINHLETAKQKYLEALNYANQTNSRVLIDSLENNLNIVKTRMGN